MKKYLLFLSLLICVQIFGQLKPDFVSEHPVNADWFAGIDNLGANYFVKDNTFFREKDEKITQYNNISFGRIEKADIINPMNIVLFYKDFNAVVFLDNQLNEIRRINFSEYREPLVVAATGNASQNRLWIYDPVNQTIGLFDYLKNSVSYLGQPIKGMIVHYETDFNYFYWIDDLGNRYAMDLFGKVNSYGRFPPENKTQFTSDSSTLYLKDGQISYFTLDGNSALVVDLGEKSATGFWYGAQNLAIFTPGKISIYKLKLR